MESQVRLADRVFQLESSCLDGEFNRILDCHIESLDFPSISSELKLLAKFYITRHQLQNNASLGMRLFNLQFGDIGGRTLEQSNPHRAKIIILTTINLLIPYILQKHKQIEAILDRNITRNIKIDFLTFENIIFAVKSINVVNFLLFLLDGAYPLLQERILGVTRDISPNNYERSRMINKSQMEFMNRHIIWESIADLTTYAIPYINFTRLKKYISSVSQMIPGLSVDKDFNTNLTKISNQACAICHNQPFNPHIIGCSHIFCYYCIRSSHLNDPSEGYVCPSCRYQTMEQAQLQRYRYLKVSLE